MVDCFKGQTEVDYLDSSFTLDASNKAQPLERRFRNADIELSEPQILENIRKVQRHQNLPVSQSLKDFTSFCAEGSYIPVKLAYERVVLAATNIHLDVEMETGTGKTYCYIKTIFEMNRRYGWSKFIIMVPSIAIREGVYKSLEITAEHFRGIYGKAARFFIYNSSRLHELENFSSDAGINVMIINIQAFNSSGKANRRIYEELDDFQSRKPIEVIASSRPVLILDEPQKMEGAATLKAFPKFEPLMILRYSATHRTLHNRIYRLDALDAYNQKLVKKISVQGIQIRGLSGTSAYLYFEGIDISKRTPLARIEVEKKLNSGLIKRQLQRLKCGDDLFIESGELNQYRAGFTVSQIDYNTDTIEFTNGLILRTGEAVGDMSEHDIRRIQIRETIRAHLNKEKQLFVHGIKVLSLFFIDEVVKYRDYEQDDEKGEYARIFEQEYEALKAEFLSELISDDEAYCDFLDGIDASQIHNGYFAIDKKTNRMEDPKVGLRAIDSDDVDAYDLILKDKERLLSFSEPTRFIFSHSALREGWDNPNIFIMCMLKRSGNVISRRQEVGRGLRLCVDKHGNRMDHPIMVHDINTLTVVASESYADFVTGLQKEIAQGLSSRPRKATKDYFMSMTIETDQGSTEITERMARQICRYLIKNDYSDDEDHITEKYHEAKAEGALATLPDDLMPFSEQIFELIDSVFNESHLPTISDNRKSQINLLNKNFEKREFQEIWQRINRKAVYRVDFDSQELISKCIVAIKDLRVMPLRYVVQAGVQHESLTESQIQSGEGFSLSSTKIEDGTGVHSAVKYDLVGKVAESSQLTRRTAARILNQIDDAIFKQYRLNPEHFISEVSRIIIDQKAAMVIECLVYDEIEERYDIDIFTASQIGQDFSSTVTGKLNNHVYDYAVTDSDVERKFVQDLDSSSEVVVYAKLPRGFLIPTPVGDYNPDWAVSFKSGSVKHIYFVAETKGSMSSLKIRGIEKAKIDCARKFFREIGRRMTKDRVKYDVITDYAMLAEIVRGAT